MSKAVWFAGVAAAMVMVGSAQAQDAQAQVPAAKPYDAAVFAKAKALQPKVIAWRRDLHEHPELSNSEVRTAKVVADHLRSLGRQADERSRATPGLQDPTAGKTGVLQRFPHLLSDGGVGVVGVECASGRGLVLVGAQGLLEVVAAGLQRLLAPPQRQVAQVAPGREQQVEGEIDQFVSRAVRQRGL